MLTLRCLEVVAGDTRRPSLNLACVLGQSIDSAWTTNRFPAHMPDSAFVIASGPHKPATAARQLLLAVGLCGPRDHETSR